MAGSQVHAFLLYRRQIYNPIGVDHASMFGSNAQCL
jgi:hypothetical protein